VQKVHTRNRQLQAWDRMLKALSDYRIQYGNCDVPANYKENLSLGRWVSAQRHKKKVGDLSASREHDLERIGFIWSPASKSWEEMYRRLCDFKEKHSNCDVPTCVKEHKELSRWVHRQRLRYRNGDLTQEHHERLDEITFLWSSCGREEKDSSRLIEHENGQQKRHGPSSPLQFGEKLYWLGNGEWVQYDGNGQKSEKIEAYVASHGGEEPPFIPLPIHPVEFQFGPIDVQPLRLRWEGRGPLPHLVLEFVRENGTLPRHAY
jgi:hypothetical protein